jgi:prepilin-type N-terminal cleavage/methylation domain-containing protein
MNPYEHDGRRRDRGFTLVELMVALVIISLASAIAVPVLQDATTKSRRNALLADGRVLYDAFMTYYVDEGHFPSEWGPDGFNKTTLAPLSTEGYFPIAQAFLGKMDQSRVLLYLAPNIGSPDSEYIAIMRSAIDPDIIIVVAHTGIIGAAGHFLDGVYLITNGELQEAGEIT